jgi:hypothetical protein
VRSPARSASPRTGTPAARATSRSGQAYERKAAEPTTTASPGAAHSPITWCQFQSRARPCAPRAGSATARTAWRVHRRGTHRYNPLSNRKRKTRLAAPVIAVPSGERVPRPIISDRCSRSVPARNACSVGLPGRTAPVAGSTQTVRRPAPGPRPSNATATGVRGAARSVTPDSRTPAGATAAARATSVSSGSRALPAGTAASCRSSVHSVSCRW